MLSKLRAANLRKDVLKQADGWLVRMEEDRPTAVLPNHRVEDWGRGCVEQIDCTEQNHFLGIWLQSYLFPLNFTKAWEGGCLERVEINHGHVFLWSRVWDPLSYSDCEMSCCSEINTAFTQCVGQLDDTKNRQIFLITQLIKFTQLMRFEAVTIFAGNQLIFAFKLK